jgi:hypothetical protein
MGLRIIFMTTVYINDNLMQEFLPKPIHSISKTLKRKRTDIIITMHVFTLYYSVRPFGNNRKKRVILYYN